ncbi:MAG: metal ABC transporter permease [Actinobacteria bacterium]|nr:metal ABC transporter permease [Actinomycetota bacterium]MCL5882489.1 metal ABC transporter permease [Actinomycetota bacterium]
MLRAFAAGITIGLVAPLIGCFLVAKRYSLIADSLAHVSLAGVAIGVILVINPIVSALGVAVLVALIIEKLRVGRLLSGEVALAMFLSSGLAVAVVLIGLAKNVHVDLFSFLFGSITTVSSQDLWIILPLGATVLAFIGLLYKELSYLAFDDESARVSGLPVRFLNQALVILTAVTVVLSLRIVGGLLIGALMVIPVAAAMQLGRSFRQTVLYAIGLGLTAVIAGLFASFYLNTAAGGTIVLISLLTFGATVAWKKIPA